jgi:hypothetical protein
MINESNYHYKNIVNFNSVALHNEGATIMLDTFALREFKKGITPIRDKLVSLSKGY